MDDLLVVNLFIDSRHFFHDSRVSVQVRLRCFSAPGKPFVIVDHPFCFRDNLTFVCQ